MADYLQSTTRTMLRPLQVQSYAFFSLYRTNGPGQKDRF
jgi:hypothetical protein